MALGIADRHLQRVSLDAVVERVAGRLAGGFEPTGNRKLGRFAGKGGRKEATLDLGAEREWHIALTTLVQIGVAPVGDDHIGQRMGRRGHETDDFGVWPRGSEKLKHAQSFAAISHRCIQPKRV